MQNQEYTPFIDAHEIIRNDVVGLFQVSPWDVK